MKNPFENMGKAVRNTVIGAVALGLSTTEGVDAQSKNSQQQHHKTEQTITVKTTWVKEAISETRANLAHVKTKEDAESLEVESLKPFLYKIGMLSEGAEAQAGYSITDYNFLLTELKELGHILDGFEKKFGYQRGNNYAYVLGQLESKSSLKGFNDQKKIGNIDKVLND